MKKLFAAFALLASVSLALAGFPSSGNQPKTGGYLNGITFTGSFSGGGWGTYNVAANQFTAAVTGTANNGAGAIRLTMASTTSFVTGTTINVSSVGGTTEANGDWVITNVNGTHIDLQGSTFTHAWTSGGTVSNIATVVCKYLNLASSFANGGSTVQLTLQGPGSGTAHIYNMYIGYYTSGNAWTFGATPTPTAITFSGSNSLTMSAAGSYVSDEITFPLAKSGSLLIAYNLSPIGVGISTTITGVVPTSGTVTPTSAATNFVCYYKTGVNEASSTTKIAGYTTATGSNDFFVSKISVR